MLKTNRTVQWLGIALLSGGLLGCGPGAEELQLRTENNALKQKLEAASSELISSKEQLRKIQSSAAQLETRNGALSITVDGLKKKLAGTQAELAQAKERLQAVSTERDALDEKAAAAQQRLQADVKNQDLLAQKAAAAEERALNLERQLEENRTALRNARAEAENLTAVNKNLKAVAARTQELATVLPLMEEERNLAREAAKSLTATNEQQAARVAELKQRLHETESAKQGLSARLLEMEQRLKAAEAPKPQAIELPLQIPVVHEPPAPPVEAASAAPAKSAETETQGQAE